MNLEFLLKNDSFDIFVENNIKKVKKTEFETTEDFNNRVEQRKLELFNVYLGKQNISIVYDADREIFNIEVSSQFDKSSSIKFVVAVAKNIAPKFKAEIKNFNIRFDSDFKIEEIFVSFQKVNYQASEISYEADWFEIQQKQHNKYLQITKDVIVLKPKIALLSLGFIASFSILWMLNKHFCFMRIFDKERFTMCELTFIDNNTGHMWEKPKDNRMTWGNAKDYCENLNLDGYSDWRLPSRDELHTLMTVYYGEYNNGWEAWFDNNKHLRNDGLFLPKEISGMFAEVGSWFWT